MVPAAAQTLYFLNPIAGLLTLYHDVLYWGRMPSLHLLGGMLLAAATVYLAGYALFRRYAAIFPEIV
jgi:ABC-type polysaccharide/polyol phosphate export permease